MTDRELMQQALEAWDMGDLRVLGPKMAALRERLAQQEQKTCLVANESCKHGSWCSEVYCQEHCKFVEQSAEPEPEPVAWADMAVRGEDKGLSWTPGHFHKTPLYTAPPKREWVGLTDQEIEDLWNQHERRFDFYSFSCDIEAKLKEKNNG